MTEEIKQSKYYVSKEYKHFLLTILAAFLGCLVALCLYNGTYLPSEPCNCEIQEMWIEPDCPKFEEHKFPKEFKGQHPNKKMPVKPQPKK